MSKKTFAKMLSIAATLAAHVYIWACVSTFFSQGGTAPDEEIRWLLYYLMRPWEWLTAPNVIAWDLLCAAATAGIFAAARALYKAFSALMDHMDHMDYSNARYVQQPDARH